MLFIIDMYPDSFTNHFHDVVDILVGWHIDSFPLKHVVAYTSRSLQRMRNFWIADLQFSLTLLGQFIEDIESYDEELSYPGIGRSSPGDEGVSCPRESLLRVTSLIAVFNTVMKCITDVVNHNLQWSFMMDCLSKMLKTVVTAIEVDDRIEILNNDDIGLSDVCKIFIFKKN